MGHLRSFIGETIRPLRREIAAFRRSRKMPAGDKLHLGCGSNLMPGWVNVDMGIPGAFDWDLLQPIPAPDGTFRFIYSEHFIEHVTLQQAIAHLRDCRRLLAIGGVLRMSTPNLRHLARCYLADDITAWTEQGWSPKTPAQFLNEGLRLWGHQFVYDRAELHNALRLAGFTTVKDCRWRESEHPELQNLEIRPFHDDLIIEAH